MGYKVDIHFAPNYDRSLAPIPATKFRDWYEDNQRTKQHVRHCLPLSMANSLGYYILSPGSFIVKWNGDTQEMATITHVDKSSHYEVDAHAANGCFVSGFFQNFNDNTSHEARGSNNCNFHSC